MNKNKYFYNNLDNIDKINQTPRIIFFTIIAFVLIFLTWANFAVIDEVTRGEGRVIPSGKIRIVQSFDGGIIQKILVHEGDIVSISQNLIQLDDIRVSAPYEALTKKIAKYNLEMARLNAEVKKIPLKLPADIVKKYPELASIETKLFNSRQNELRSLETTRDLSARELELIIPLVKKGAASEVEVLQLKKQYNEQLNKLHAFNSNTLKAWHETRDQLLSISDHYQSTKDKLTKTSITSPINGIIKKININTIGGVVKPGMDLIEIVPLDDSLLIEAKIKPADIGFIYPAQKVLVKLSAYDFSRYGGLDGTVEHISADTIKDESSGDFYIIKIRTKQNYLLNKQEKLHIIPGMLAEVNILTGKKSILSYILKPIIHAQDKALREK